MLSIEQPVPSESDDPTDEIVDELDDEPTQEDVEPDLVTYEVIGRQPVDEVKKGGLLYLDPDDPRTSRLIERGQIVRVDTTQED